MATPKRFYVLDEKGKPIAGPWTYSRCREFIQLEQHRGTSPGILRISGRI